MFRGGGDGKEPKSVTFSRIIWMTLYGLFKFAFQDKMAEHMKTYLGSMLYTDPVEDHRTALPSPEELKQKILVKYFN